MLIMIAGPYLTGAKTQAQRDENLRKMNDAAGADSFERIMMPVSLALAQRCDAVLRIGGTSNGADQEVEVIQKNGGTGFRSVEEIPPTAR